MPLRDLRAIYEVLFRDGVMVAKKDKRPQVKHAEIQDVTNLQVIRAMGSLKSRGFVKETFAWRHFYWYLTNEGIVHLREFLKLPPEIVPASLQRVRKPHTTFAFGQRAAGVQTVEGPTSYIPKPGRRMETESQDALAERQVYRRRVMESGEKASYFDKTPRFRGRPLQETKASQEMADHSQSLFTKEKWFSSEDSTLKKVNQQQQHGASGDRPAEHERRVVKTEKATGSAQFSKGIATRDASEFGAASLSTLPLTVAATTGAVALKVSAEPSPPKTNKDKPLKITEGRALNKPTEQITSYFTHTVPDAQEKKVHKKMVIVEQKRSAEVKPNAEFPMDKVKVKTNAQEAFNGSATAIPVITKPVIRDADKITAVKTTAQLAKPPGTKTIAESKDQSSKTPKLTDQLSGIDTSKSTMCADGVQIPHEVKGFEVTPEQASTVTESAPHEVIAVGFSSATVAPAKMPKSVQVVSKGNKIITEQDKTEEQERTTVSENWSSAKNVSDTGSKSKQKKAKSETCRGPTAKSPPDTKVQREEANKKGPIEERNINQLSTSMKPLRRQPDVKQDTDQEQRMLVSGESEATLIRDVAKENVPQILAASTMHCEPNTHGTEETSVNKTSLITTEKITNVQIIPGSLAAERKIPTVQTKDKPEEKTHQSKPVINDKTPVHEASSVSESDSHQEAAVSSKLQRKKKKFLPETSLEKIPDEKEEMTKESYFEENAFQPKSIPAQMSAHSKRSDIDRVQMHIVSNKNTDMSKETVSVSSAALPVEPSDTVVKPEESVTEAKTVSVQKIEIIQETSMRELKSHVVHPETQEPDMKESTAEAPMTQQIKTEKVIPPVIKDREATEALKVTVHEPSPVAESASHEDAEVSSKLKQKKKKSVSETPKDTSPETKADVKKEPVTGSHSEEKSERSAGIPLLSTATDKSKDKCDTDEEQLKKIEKIQQISKSSLSQSSTVPQVEPAQNAQVTENISLSKTSLETRSTKEKTVTKVTQIKIPTALSEKQPPGCTVDTTLTVQTTEITLVGKDQKVEEAPKPEPIASVENREAVTSRKSKNKKTKSVIKLSQRTDNLPQEHKEEPSTEEENINQHSSGITPLFTESIEFKVKHVTEKEQIKTISTESDGRPIQEVPTEPESQFTSLSSTAPLVELTGTAHVTKNITISKTSLEPTSPKEKAVATVEKSEVKTVTVQKTTKTKITQDNFTSEDKLPATPLETQEQTKTDVKVISVVIHEKTPDTLDSTVQEPSALDGNGSEVAEVSSKSKRKKKKSLCETHKESSPDIKADVKKETAPESHSKEDHIHQTAVPLFSTATEKYKDKCDIHTEQMKKTGQIKMTEIHEISKESAASESSAAPPVELLQNLHGSDKMSVSKTSPKEENVTAVADVKPEESVTKEKTVTVQKITQIETIQESLIPDLKIPVAVTETQEPVKNKPTVQESITEHTQTEVKDIPSVEDETSPEEARILEVRKQVAEVSSKSKRKKKKSLGEKTGAETKVDVKEETVKDTHTVEESIQPMAFSLSKDMTEISKETVSQSSVLPPVELPQNAQVTENVSVSKTSPKEENVCSTEESVTIKRVHKISTADILQECPVAQRETQEHVKKTVTDRTLKVVPAVKKDENSPEGLKVTVQEPTAKAEKPAPEASSKSKRKKKKTPTAEHPDMKEEKKETSAGIHTDIPTRLAENSTPEVKPDTDKGRIIQVSKEADNKPMKEISLATLSHSISQQPTAQPEELKDNVIKYIAEETHTEKTMEASSPKEGPVSKEETVDSKEKVVSKGQTVLKITQVEITEKPAVEPKSPQSPVKTTESTKSKMRGKGKKQAQGQLSDTLNTKPVLLPEAEVLISTESKVIVPGSPVVTSQMTEGNISPKMTLKRMCSEEIMQAAAVLPEAPADKREVEPALLCAKKFQQEVLKAETSSTALEAPTSGESASAAPALTAAETAAAQAQDSPLHKQREPPKVAQHSASQAAESSTEKKLAVSKSLQQTQETKKKKASAKDTPSITATPATSQPHLGDTSYSITSETDEANMRRKIVVVEEIVEVKQIVSPQEAGSQSPPPPVQHEGEEELDLDVLEELAIERSLLQGAPPPTFEEASYEGYWDHTLEEPEEKTWPHFTEG